MGKFFFLGWMWFTFAYCATNQRILWLDVGRFTCSPYGRDLKWLEDVDPHRILMPTKGACSPVAGAERSEGLRKHGQAYAAHPAGDLRGFNLLGMACRLEQNAFREGFSKPCTLTHTHTHIYIYNIKITVTLIFLYLLFGFWYGY